jgi:hypothetical protein
MSVEPSTGRYRSRLIVLPGLAAECQRRLWGPQQLSDRAGIHYDTATRAIEGQRVRPEVARKIAEALMAERDELVRTLLREPSQ